MQELKISDTLRKAFPGFRLQGYLHISDCWTYTSFELVWRPCMKEEFNQDDNRITISLNMN